MLHDRLSVTIRVFTSFLLRGLMKHLALTVLLLASLLVEAHAGDPQNLHEWLYVQGFADFQYKYGVGDRFSFLPNFGGLNMPHAIAIEYYSPGRKAAQIWSLNSPSDTVGRVVLNYGFADRVVPVDINGDGLTDYIGVNGYVYLGMQNKFPDTSKAYNLKCNPVHRAGSLQNSYGKYLGDSADCIVTYHLASISAINDNHILRFIWGGKRFSSLQSTVVTSPYAQDSTKSELPIVVYQNHEGKWRLLTSTFASHGTSLPNDHRRFNIPEESGLRMYDITFKQTQDSVAVILSLIDTYKSADWLSYTFYQFEFNPVSGADGGLLINSQKRPEILYYCPIQLAPSDRGVQGNYVLPTFDLTHDKFEIVETNAAINVAGGHFLAESPCGDSATYVAVTAKNNQFDIYAIPRDSYLPVKRLHYELPNPALTIADDISTIGDVNGDGIPDIAAVFGGGTEASVFVVLKGISEGTSVHTPDSISSDLAIHTPLPSPSQSGYMTVPINVAQSGLYQIQLYSMDLRSSNTLWQGELSAGQHLMPIDVSSFASGSYVLQLAGGGKSVQTRLLLTK